MSKVTPSEQRPWHTGLMWGSRVLAVSVCALAACGEVITEPEQAGVTIIPSAPKTADDLVAVANVDDVTLQWSKNGAPAVTGGLVASNLTAKGESWGVDAVAAGGAVIGHAEVVIGNTAPSMFDVEVQLMGAENTDVPCLLVTPPTDDDGDTLTYSASWLRNGVAYGSAKMTMFARDTVPATDHAATDQFECTVSATDGTDAQTAVSGARWFVANGAPPNGTLQTFTTPSVSSLVIEVGGAEGGGGAETYGAKLVGTFTPSAGTQLQILVGQRPAGYLAGGGGTFVMAPSNMPLIIAGSGGSVTGGIAAAESVGRVETSGGTTGMTARADMGQGGRIVAGANSGGGGGLLGTGEGGTGGKAFSAGGAGGGIMAENQWGGYGGGGGRGGLWGQGGGGGYSGGSCGDTYTPAVPGGATMNTGEWAGCGGGGSLNTGMLQTNTAGAVAGNGYVKFSW